MPFATLRIRAYGNLGEERRKVTPHLRPDQKFTPHLSSTGLLQGTIAKFPGMYPLIFVPFFLK